MAKLYVDPPSHTQRPLRLCEILLLASQTRERSEGDIAFLHGTKSASV